MLLKYYFSLKFNSTDGLKVVEEIWVFMSVIHEYESQLVIIHMMLSKPLCHSSFCGIKISNSTLQRVDSY